MDGDEAQRKAREDGSNVTEYRLDDILKFIDQLYDLSALTYNERAFGFTAHGKAWFKGKIHAYLRKLANSSEWKQSLLSQKSSYFKHHKAW